MGIADALTNLKLGSSALSRSSSVVQPKAQSWRKMYEPLVCTASMTCRMERLCRGLPVGVNKTYLLPGLDLSIGDMFVYVVSVEHNWTRRAFPCKCSPHLRCFY